MQKPELELEKQFNKDGIFFLEKSKISEFEGHHIGVKVEIAILTDDKITAPDFGISIINRRDVAILITDWDIFERNDQKILSFRASEQVPTEVISYIPHSANQYMSFIDLCWYVGNEAIPEAYGVDVITKAPEGSQAVDLGWMMPSRFVDFFIDAVDKLDKTVLGGNMEQALLYGPLVHIDTKL